MQSKYIKVYEDIKENISNGILKESDKLPSESELMKNYSSSRDTIRKALDLLQLNGYISKIKGKGSFVLNIPNKYDFPITGLISFTEMVKSMGAKSETDIVEFKIDKPTPKEMEIFNISPLEKLTTIKRRRTLNGQRVILDIDILNTKLVKDINKRIAKKSIFKYLEEELKYKIGFARKEISVVKATLEDKEFLDMLDYDLIVLVDTIIYLEDGTIIQHTQSRHRPDKFKFIDFAKRRNLNKE